MAIDDIYKLSIVGEYGLGQEFVNTFHYKQLADPADPPAEALAIAFRDACIPTYLDLLLDSSEVIQLEVRQVTGGLAAFDLAIAEFGTNSGVDQLPPQVSPLVSWRTGLAGRRNRGRTYLPAPPENVQDAGALTSGFVSSITTWANTTLLLTIEDVETWQHVVYGAPCPSCTPPRSENIVNITSFLVRNDLRTQRRRVVGVGS